MAIAQLLAQILSAQYGRDVRQAIHDAIEENYEDVSTAKTLANTATNSANTAALNANEKATLANTKAGLADSAATLANQKAGLADSAATLANQKAALADTKAGLADSAASLANQKAGLADAAATLANTKAALADEKATLANTKAGLADTAATGANAAKVTTEAATLAALASLDSTANWTKDGRNPAEYFPAPSAPLYFRREGTFTQAGSGDPSPTNIRPITPWMANGAKVALKNSGKNLLPYPYYDTTKTQNGITFTVGSDKTITVNGTATGDAIFLIDEKGYNRTFVCPSAYTISGVFSGSVTGAAFQFFVNKYTLANAYVSTVAGIMAIGGTYSFAISDVDCEQYKFEVGFFIQPGAVVSNLVIKPQIELGSVATPYEPYVGSTAELTAPEEIAAGWMDNRGNGQKTWVKKVFNGTETPTLISTDTNTIKIAYYISGNKYNTPPVSSHFVGGSYSATDEEKVMIGGSPDVHFKINKSRLIGWDEGWTNQQKGDAFKAWLAAQYAAGTPVTVYYQLATPTALTPITAPLNTIPATDLTQERLNVLTSSMNGVLTYPKSKVGENRKLWNSQLWRKTSAGNPVSVYPVPESPLYPKVSGTFTQEGTGDPSPENIRPITPWLASGVQVKVKRTGRQLIPYPYYDTSKTVNGVTITVNSDGTILFSGTATANFSFWLRHTDSPITLKAGVYAVSAGYASTSVSTIYMEVVRKYDGEGRIQIFTNGSPSGSFTLTKDAKVDIRYGVVSGVTLNNVLMKPQLELGSTATPYEPYSGQEITLTAPQEIAAGWMDNEGNGQVTYIRYILDGLGTWAVAGTNASGMSVVRGALERVNQEDLSVYKCSHALMVSGSVLTPAPMEFRYLRGGASNQLAFFVPYSMCADIDAWKAYLAAQYAAGTPVTVCYQLATPINITPVFVPLTAAPQLDRITPRQNVLTASTGNIELTYAKSPIREADELAAAIALL